MKNKRKKLSGRLVVVIGSILIVLSLIPYKTTIVPEWKLTAIDDQGNAVPYARFRQGWDNYSYNIRGMEFVQANEAGVAVLPERSFYAPLIYRGPRSFFAYLNILNHGSVGNDASLNALSEKCSSEHLTYKQILALPEVIVIDC